MALKDKYGEVLINRNLKFPSRLALRIIFKYE